jgi:1,4-dihydroxy-2-naphthoyl-CoA hydrolase
MPQSFIYDRQIHFADTDAAGVVYFANGLKICHEAYETSLAAAGIDLRTFFKGEAIAVPITHASIDFFKPMFCGDRLAISLKSTLLTPASFQIDYQIYQSESSAKAIATAITKHICIDAQRHRCSLSPELLQWLELTKNNY